MAIVDEVERIKRNIANTYDVLEELGAEVPENKNSDNLRIVATTVPTGASINGKLEQKIASGTIIKGDIVVATEQRKLSHLSDANDLVIKTSDTSIGSSVLEYLLDENDETSITVKGPANGSYPTVAFRLPSCETLGISKDAIILGYTMKIKHKESTTSFSSIYLYLSKFTAFNPSAGTYTQTSLVPTYRLTATTTAREDSLSASDLYFSAENLQNYGGMFYTYPGNVNYYATLFYVKWEITYLDSGIVKTVTTSGDKIVGVSNSDGTEGDTVEVFVPNI